MSMIQFIMSLNVGAAQLPQDSFTYEFPIELK